MSTPNGVNVTSGWCRAVSWPVSGGRVAPRSDAYRDPLPHTRSMAQVPGDPGTSKLGYVMVLLGIVEVGIAVWLAVLTGMWWILLLGLLAIPNFYVGIARIRAAERGR